MTNPDYTHITILCDRSGSMHGVSTDASGAINKFVADQQAQPGKATLLLADFDAGDSDWYRVVFHGDLAAAPSYRLDARGSTALLDATARVIHETGAYLAAMDEADRPDKVLVVVQTDGMENSSREHDLQSVRKLIEHQQTTYSWEFVFLGMGLDVDRQGHATGFTNVAASQGRGRDYDSSYAALSERASQYRRGEAPLDMNVDVVEDGSVVDRSARRHPSNGQ